jgi:Kef-type K+ transport system membrane component KefB
VHGFDMASLVIVFAIAAATPLLADLPRRIRVPGVVLEILLGIVVGPQVLGWVELDELIDVLAEFGLAFLIFLAGYEIDVAKVRGRPLRQASIAWVGSLALGLAAGLAVSGAGIALSALVVGLALTTTALGTLVPIVRDAGHGASPFGVHVLANGAVGEFGPIVAIALVLTSDRPLTSALALAAFFAIAAVAVWLSMRPVSPRLSRLMCTTLEASGQLLIRIAVLAIAALVWWAAELRLDILLGAFTAGVVLRLLVHSAVDHHGVHLVDTKLEAIGFGFLIPLFFVVTGVRFDVEALGDPGTLARVPLYLLLFLVARGIPVLVAHRGVLEPHLVRALALVSSAALPLVVVITEIGKETGRMRADNAAALVGAGLVSIIVFPIVGMAIAGRVTASAASPT